MMYKSFAGENRRFKYFAVGLKVDVCAVLGRFAYNRKGSFYISSLFLFIKLAVNGNPYGKPFA